MKYDEHKNMSDEKIEKIIKERQSELNAMEKPKDTNKFIEMLLLVLTIIVFIYINALLILSIL